MYHRYFGLDEAPFSIAVDPRYLFMSARHRDALAHLLYGVGIGGGFILLTGEVGTGKTTITRSLLQQLPENTDIALILNPALDATQLLASACDELGIDYAADQQNLKNLTDKLHQFLLDNHARGRNTVLLIDEAQHLQFDVLEQIRLLTNLETNTKKLLQIILVGQPELRDLLNRPELRQLAQRITARYQLKPLNLQEAQDYIRHRLHIAGLPANQELFPKPIVKIIHKTSRGIPRLINVICDRVLMGTYGQNKTVVDKPLLKQAVTEVMGEEEELQTPAPSLLPWLTSAAAIAAIGFSAWLLLQNPPGEPVATVPAMTPAVSAAEIPSELAASTPVTKPSTEAKPWYDNQQQAITALAKTLGLNDNNCGDTNTGQLQCEQLRVESWQALQTYNRPAVLTLITPAKMQHYLVLTGIDDNQANVVFQGQQQTVDLETIGTLWNGEFLFLWQPESFYTGPIGLNDSGPMVNWLAQQFASLDQQDTPLASDSFTPQLAQRVKIFQQNHQLEADGVVGVQTILKLQEQLGTTQTLIGGGH